MSLLIERQIGRLPDVAILERSRLEHVNREVLRRRQPFRRPGNCGRRY